MDDYQLAIAHYRLLFPDLASLKNGDEDTTGVAKWKAEYDRVGAFGLSATLIVSTSMEGGAGGAIKNFPQKTLLSALHARRGELDGDYLATLQLPSPVIGQPAGSVIRLGIC